MKRKLFAVMIAVFLLGVLLSPVFRGNKEIYDKYEKYKYGFIPYYSSIEADCSDKDRLIAEEIIALAENIACGAYDSIPERAGELIVYAPEYNSDENNLTGRKGTFKLITADFSFGNGYIWSEYNKTDFYTDGREEESNYLVYWKLSNRNDIWIVTKIKEEKIL